MHHKVIKPIGVFFVLILLMLIAGRIYLPYWLTGYVNKQLNALDGYSGQVEDIDVHLWRGAYEIRNIDIKKDSGGLKKAFFYARTIDLSIEWRALLNGRIVAEIQMYKPMVNFSKTQTGSGAGWPELVDRLTPFDINRFNVTGGKASYIDYTADPNINVFIEDINADISNLRNTSNSDKNLPTNIEISGRSIGGGTLSIHGSANVLKNVPDFDIDSELKDAKLSAFNDYTRAAAAVDFSKGQVGVFSELAAADGALTGYVKISAEDIDVVDVSDQDKNIFNAMWESIVSSFMNIFKNHPRDRFAFNLPIEGRVDQPDQKTWPAFLSIFANTFGQAFPKDTDGNIDFQKALEKHQK